MDTSDQLRNKRKNVFTQNKTNQQLNKLENYFIWFLNLMIAFLVERKLFTIWTVYWVFELQHSIKNL